jgi:hypothetical protein
LRGRDDERSNDVRVVEGAAHVLTAADIGPRCVLDDSDVDDRSFRGVRGVVVDRDGVRGAWSCVDGNP